MTKYDDLTRCLLAAGGAPSAEGEGMSLVYEEDSELIVKEWTGSEFEEQTKITSGVKKNTDAPYIQVGDKRLVFCIDEANTLECYKYNAEGQDWDEVTLGEVAINVHPQSKLAACLSPRGIMVFFQDPTGALKGRASGRESWTNIDTIPAKPYSGCALSVIVADDKPHLFYLHEDKNIHYVVQSLESDTMEDHILENSHIDSPVTRLIVSQDPETKALVAAFLAADSLIIIENSGTRKELGKVVKGKFVPDTSAQSILVGYIPVYVNWQGQYQGAMRSVNNNYWNLLGY